MNQEYSLIMKSGEIYRALKDIPCRGHKSFFEKGSGERAGLGMVVIPKDAAFVFVENIEVNKSTYSKVLFEDKILVTYNAYQLNGMVKLVPNEKF